LFPENYEKFTISLFIENKFNHKNSRSETLWFSKQKSNWSNYFKVIPLK
jgi:hypothetical protein